MKSRRIARGLFATASLAVVLTVAACGSSADGGSANSTHPAAPATSADDELSAADEAAVRSLLDQVNEAWEHGDATAYAAVHTPDANLIDFRGTHAIGRQAIIDLLQPLFDGPLKDTRVEAHITDLRFLSTDVAIFHTEGEIVPTRASSIQTFVATKGPEGWLIAAFQNTRMEPT